MSIVTNSGIVSIDIDIVVWLPPTTITFAFITMPPASTRSTSSISSSLAPLGSKFMLTLMQLSSGNYVGVYNEDGGRLTADLGRSQPRPKAGVIGATTAPLINMLVLAPPLVEQFFHRFAFMLMASLCIYVGADINVEQCCSTSTLMLM